MQRVKKEYQEIYLILLFRPMISMALKVENDKWVHADSVPAAECLHSQHTTQTSIALNVIQHEQPHSGKKTQITSNKSCKHNTFDTSITSSVIHGGLFNNRFLQVFHSSQFIYYSFVVCCFSSCSFYWTVGCRCCTKKGRKHTQIWWFRHCQRQWSEKNLIWLVCTSTEKDNLIWITRITNII